ncbi:MAG: hypothetical protein J1E56_02170 [Ruminococcus sp.]|nr:hypothetical protein [Ruminococcus sp.]
MNEFIFVVIIAFFLTIAGILIYFISKKLVVFTYSKIKTFLQKHIVIGRTK